MDDVFNLNTNPMNKKVTEKINSILSSGLTSCNINGTYDSHEAASVITLVSTDKHN